MFFQTYGLALSFLIRAEGNTIVPMIGMVGGAIANTILCAIFIVGMGMGVKGSALATVIAEVISVIYFMSYYFTGKSYLKFRLRDLMPLWGILKEIMVIGISAMVMMLAGSVSSIIVNRSVVAFGGDLAMAAFGVLNRITMLTWMPSIVVGEGMQPILGFNYGARRYDRTLKVIRLASIAATVLSIMAFAVCYFVPAPLMRIFTDDSAVITQGVYAIRRIVLLAFLTGVTEIGSMVFQSIGKAVPSFITSVARPILFLIPLVLILPMYLQLDGVWLAFPITDGLAFLLTIALFIPQLRQFQRLSRPAATST
jgi:Na+-driven multidrug efflux pump